jgi:phage shock protein A
MMDFEFSVGGYNIKGWMVAVALPVLSTVAGGVWWSYDTLQRFYGVEAGIAEVVDKSASFDAKAGQLDKRVTSVETNAQRNLTQVNNNLSGEIVALDSLLLSKYQELEAKLIVRIQTLEQAIADNDVRGLNQKLAQLSTNMTQILEQQKLLLDLRSQVDKATTITDGLGDTLKTLNTEIDDIWKAYDELADNPL